MQAFFNDPKGKPSSMRLMSFLALFIAAALALIPMLSYGAQAGNPEHVLYFLVAAFAPKAVQKFAENKSA